jgi:hypothetical protein
MAQNAFKRIVVQCEVSRCHMMLSCVALSFSTYQVSRNSMCISLSPLQFNPNLIYIFFYFWEFEDVHMFLPPSLLLSATVRYPPLLSLAPWSALFFFFFSL